MLRHIICLTLLSLCASPAVGEMWLARSVSNPETELRLVPDYVNETARGSYIYRQFSGSLFDSAAAWPTTFEKFAIVDPNPQTTRELPQFQAIVPMVTDDGFYAWDAMIWQGVGEPDCCNVHTVTGINIDPLLGGIELPDGAIGSSEHFQNVSRHPAGDSNLDGQFNSGDLIAVFAAALYEQPFDELNPVTWELGDWNADGVFNSTDLVAALVEGENNQAGAVPEPATAMLLLVGGLAILRWRQPASRATR